MRLIYGFLACLFVLPLSLQAQVYGLDDVLSLALEQHWNLKLAQGDLQISKNNNNYGEAGRYPVITANLNSQNAYTNINNPTSFLNGAQLLNGNLAPGVELNWVLYDGNRVKINKQRLELLERQGQQALDAQTVQVLVSVMQAYYQAQIQALRWEMLGEVLARSRDKMTYVEARLAYGQATEFDRLQVYDAYLNDSIQWTLQRNQYQQSLLNLALQMGLPAETSTQSWVLKDSISYEMSAYVYEVLADELRVSNQELRRLRLQSEMAKIEVDLQRAQRLPRLSMVGTASEQLTLAKIEGRQPQIPNDWVTGNTLNFGLGFNLTYVLYNGGRIKRSIANAGLRQNLAEMQRGEAERQLLHQLKIQLARYDNQKEVLGLSLQLLENARRNVAISEERFRVGTLNFFDFRSIQINYLRSAYAVQDAFLTAKMAEIDLWRSVGRLMGRDAD